METVFTLIIVALVFGFQIYANFKKELEKAQKRNPSQKSAEKIPEAYSRHQSRPINRKERIPVEQKKPLGNSKHLAVEEIDEITRGKAIHKPHRHAFQRLDPFVMLEEEDESSVHANFDLRDAVIKSIILERPYK